MDTTMGDRLTPEQEIRSLKSELRKTQRKLEHLERDRRIMAAMFDQSIRLRDLKDAEAKKQAYYTSTILDNCPEFIFLLNKELVVLLTTDYFYQTAGLTTPITDLPLRQALSSILSEAWINKLEELAHTVIATKETTSLIERIDFGKASGSIYELLMNPTINPADGTVFGVILIFRDITALVEAKERAEAADVAKSNFLANMSHEIRTPLNAIMGLTEFILRDALTPSVKDYAAQIKDSSQTLLAIINDILDFSKIEAGRLEIVNTEFQLSSLIHTVNNVVTPFIQKKKLDFKLQVDPSLPKVLFADEQRLQQILLNLLTNAIKYTSKGSVNLKLWGEPLPTADPASPNRRLRFFASVTDTGIGIKAKDQDKIFQSFIRADTTRNRSITGTGLGLSISQMLAHAMHGEITLESVYGQGSTFTFSVECEAVGTERIGAFAAEGAETRTRAFKCSFRAPRLKLLIVDDNLINLGVAEGIFAPYQCHITTASSGSEAIELAQRHAYDIIFMDHMMPVMNGIEAMHHIRCLPGYAETPIIALTANAIRGMRETYLAEGFSEYLSKPINLAEADSLLSKFTPAAYKLQPAAASNRPSQAEDTETLKLVYKEGTEKIQLLPRLLQEGDLDNYTIQVHSLKSVAALIGETELSEVAKSHEQAGKEGRKEYIEQELSQLLKCYQGVLARIEQKLAATAIDSKPLPCKKVSEDELLLLSQRMEQALDSFDLDTFAELVQEARQIHLSDQQASCLSSMEEALTNFDFDRLSELLPLFKH